MVAESRATLDEIYAVEPLWTRNETVLVVNDFYNMTKGTEVAAAFQDGSILAQDHPRYKDVFSKTNFILMPRSLVSSHEAARSVFAHELSHAYNQGKLPQIIDEGLSDIARNLIDRKIDPEMAAEAEREYKAICERYNIPAYTENRHFVETIENNPFLGRLFYKAANHLFIQWYDTHPTFFRELRKRENEFYKTTHELPTFEDWKNIGERVETGFKVWIESQPILNIPD